MADQTAYQRICAEACNSTSPEFREELKVNEQNNPTTNDPAILEAALCKDPDWDCPRCRTINKAIRGRCRNCGFDSEMVSEGVEMGAGQVKP